MVRIHVLFHSPWIPISVAKVYGQHEAHKASLEIAYICYQLFVAECFGKVDYLGEDESSIFNTYNLLCLILGLNTYVWKHPPKSDGCVPFVSSGIFPLFLTALSIVTLLSTNSLLLYPFLLCVSKFSSLSLPSPYLHWKL